MLKWRVITGLVLASAVIGILLFLPSYVSEGLIFMVTFLAALEYADLVGWSAKKKYIFASVVSLLPLILTSPLPDYFHLKTYFSDLIKTFVWCGMVYWLHIMVNLWTYSGKKAPWPRLKRFSTVPNFIKWGFIILILIMVYLIKSIAIKWFILIQLLSYIFKNSRKVSQHQKVNIRPIFSGYGFISSALVMLVLLKSANGKWLLLLLLLQVCANDTMAYFVGRAFGKYPLAPKISPKKTMEGMLGGIVASVLVTWLFFQYKSGDTNIETMLLLLILAVVVSLFAVIGDLFESMLKREAGVKDSGKILPGHGGVYDRIDGLVAAAPFFTEGLCFIVTKLY